jgi:hypothetical protein
MIIVRYSFVKAASTAIAISQDRGSLVEQHHLRNIIIYKYGSRMRPRFQQMRMPGVEPGSQAWEACMMPLHYMRHGGILNRHHLISYIQKR